MEDAKLFLDAKDVSEILIVSKPKAYELIRLLNAELTAMGKITVRGRVSKSYLISRMEITDKEKHYERKTL